MTAPATSMEWTLPEGYGEFEYTPDATRYAPYPVGGWRRGNQRPPMPGFCYFRASDLSGEPGAPWVGAEVYDDEPGYVASAFSVLVLGMRKTAFIGSGKDKEYLKHYDRSLRGCRLLTEALCLVEGIDEPVILTFSGLNGKGFSEAYNAFVKMVVTPATRAFHKSLPPFAFWMPISAEFDAKGKPIVRETDVPGSKEKGFVTPPVLKLAEAEPSPAYIQSLMADVGQAFYAAQVREDARDWLKSNRYLERLERTGGVDVAPRNGDGNGAFTEAELPPDVF